MAALKLSVREWGEGAQDALLLHGFTGDARSFDGLRPHAPWLRAIAVDLPGHGRSALPDASGAEGCDATLCALERILERFDRPIHVIGYSMGARLALGLALRCPDRVARLVLESGSPGLQRRKARAERRRSDEVLARRIERDGLASFLRSWEALPLFDGLRDLHSWIRREADPVGLAGALRCLGTGIQPSYWRQLPHLRTPTLLLTGANDAKFSAIAQRMAAELPLGWHEALDGVWHVPHLEAPARFAAEVGAFLRARFGEGELSSKEAS